MYLIVTVQSQVVVLSSVFEYKMYLLHKAKIKTLEVLYSRDGATLGNEGKGHVGWSHL